MCCSRTFTCIIWKYKYYHISLLFLSHLLFFSSISFEESARDDSIQKKHLPRHSRRNVKTGRHGNFHIFSVSLRHFCHLSLKSLILIQFGNWSTCCFVVFGSKITPNWHLFFVPFMFPCITECMVNCLTCSWFVDCRPWVSRPYTLFSGRPKMELFWVKFTIRTI